MKTFSQSFLDEAKRYFKHIADSREYSIALLNDFKSKYNDYIAKKQFSELSSLNEMLNQSDFIPGAVSRKLLLITEITEAELRTSYVPLFVSDVSDCDDAITKYTNCVFALRRINLSLSPELEASAIDYLRSINISPYALITLLANELFEDFSLILDKISNDISDIWQFPHSSCFAMNIAECFPTESNLIRVASLFLDVQDYSMALEYLKKIPSPSGDTLEFIDSLVKIISGE